MSRNFLKSAQMFLAGTLAFSACSVFAMAAPVPAYPKARQSQADNTRENKNQTPPTAGQQNNNTSDLAITRQIRKAIHDDKNLSTYASNVKIITQDGKVTLRGPVRSEEEKTTVEAKAVAAAGRGNVTNELTIAPAK